MGSVLIMLLSFAVALGVEWMLLSAILSALSRVGGKEEAIFSQVSTDSTESPRS